LITINSVSFFSNPPDREVLLAVSSDVIQGIQEEELENEFDFQMNNQLYLLIPLILNPCVKGQIFNKDSWFCQKCPFGKFSLDTNDKECRICPENIVCEGGENLNLMPGFWRTSNESLEVLPCEPNSLSCL
jgi:hypothetical protein